MRCSASRRHGGTKAGSSGKKRVHIFWQRRIVEGDLYTPFWFPSQTNQGAIREDRLVLPIPPGVHWREVMPVVLPSEVARLEDKKKNTGEAPVPPKIKKKPALARLCGLFFERPKPVVEKPKREKKAKVKNDPRHVAAARELRDRYLEQFNGGLVLPNAKYDVGRTLTAPTTPLLDAA